MKIIYAVQYGYNEELYRDIKETYESIERVYYKLALVEELDHEKSTVILSQKLEDNLKVEDIIEIFKRATSNSILILEEKYRDSELLIELLDNGIYNCVFADDVDSDYIIHLLNNKRNIDEAKEYYSILPDFIENNKDTSKEKFKLNPFKLLKK